MAKKATGKGKWFYGKRMRSSGGPGKAMKKRKVWREHPVGSGKGRARCQCHYMYPCNAKKAA